MYCNRTGARPCFIGIGMYCNRTGARPCFIGIGMYYNRTGASILNGYAFLWKTLCIGNFFLFCSHNYCKEIKIKLCKVTLLNFSNTQAEIKLS